MRFCGWTKRGNWTLPQTQTEPLEVVPPAVSPPTVVPPTVVPPTVVPPTVVPPTDIPSNDIDPPLDEPDSTVRRPGIIPNITKSKDSIQINKKDAKDEEVIKKAIAGNEFLSQVIKGKKLEDIVNAMYKQEIDANKVLMKIGDSGDKMYVLHSGKLKFKGKNFEFIEDKQIVFGELAILYKAGRLATIKAVTKAQVWVLESSIYYQIIDKSNQEEHEERIAFLRQVKTLKSVEDSLLHQGADHLEKEFFKPETAIIRQGDRGDKFYIISAGTVTISKEGVGEIGKLSKGQSFGELALQGEDCRQATVTANAPGVECLTLTKEHFDVYFMGVGTVYIAPNELNEEHKDIDLHDLKIEATLGIGAFGRVELVTNKKSKNQVFALKYIKKQYIVEQQLQEHVFNEKLLQVPCRSLFIVRSFRTFKDNKYVYFLMEPCLGGDLFGLLHRQRNKQFPEKDAKFIAGCVIEALDYLHSRKIIYRDLKPENLMIDRTGYIKLTDFGYAKKMGAGKTHTFAGTPEYVAPEILLNKGHDKGVDYWAYGALIFELLTGKTPFRTDDPNHIKTYNKILSGVINFPSIIDSKARNIIEKLLRPLSKDRLGMQRNGIEDIRKHTWYSGFDWAELKSGKMSSSFTPKLAHPLDVRYFERFPKDTDIPDDEFSGWDEKF